MIMCLFMKLSNIIQFSISIFLFFACATPKNLNVENNLTPEESAEGWYLLWDGKTTEGWRGINKSEFPRYGWKIENGELKCLGEGVEDSLRGGDIITKKRFKNFELKFDFKITKFGNSGIKYFVDESLSESRFHGLGLEYAILDNDQWPYDREDYSRTSGSLYDFIRAPDSAIVYIDKWNQGFIRVYNNHIEHWLNGIKTVDVIKNSSEYNYLLSKSKYSGIENWGSFETGHILIQDEGPASVFRNIKIRVL